MTAPERPSAEAAIDDVVRDTHALAARPTSLTASDLLALADAVEALEGSSFASHLAKLVGRQVGFAGELIPAGITETANKAASRALRYALRAAVKSLKPGIRPASNRFHLAAVAASGAVGGAFGFVSLPLELPLSTGLILRSVADIAREQGEDLNDPEAVLSCLQVFALGSGREAALGQSSYFAVRALLAKSVTEAARYMVGRGLVEESAPVLARLLGQIASRFGLVVSQKAVAQAVPVLGAVTGAAINASFMDHYQTLAHAHFTVRRLERLYGEEVVRTAYETLRASDLGRNTQAEGLGQLDSPGTRRLGSFPP